MWRNAKQYDRAITRSYRRQLQDQGVVMSEQTSPIVPVPSDPNEHANEENDNADTAEDANDASVDENADETESLPPRTNEYINTVSPELAHAEREGELSPEFVELTPFNSMAQGGLQLDESISRIFKEDVEVLPRTVQQPLVSPVTNRQVYEVINPQNASRQQVSGPGLDGVDRFNGARPRVTRNTDLTGLGNYVAPTGERAISPERAIGRETNHGRLLLNRLESARRLREAGNRAQMRQIEENQERHRQDYLQERTRWQENQDRMEAEMNLLRQQVQQLQLQNQQPMSPALPQDAAGNMAVSPQPYWSPPGQPRPNTPGRPPQQFPGPSPQNTPGRPRLQTPGRPIVITPGRPRQPAPGMQQPLLGNPQQIGPLQPLNMAQPPFIHPLQVNFPLRNFRPF